MTCLHSNVSVVAVGFLAVLLPAMAQQPAPPPAPTPGSAATIMTGQQLTAALRAAVAKHSDPALSAIGVNDQYSIHEVHRSKAGPPAVHEGWTELHFILEGSGTLVTAGKITVTGTESVITGGVTRKVQKGDAVIVPPNTPHWYQQVDHSLTYLEVRFIAPTAAIPSK